jgi:hypothetical protein
VKPRAFHPEANEEYAEAAEYYARISQELAARFYDQIEQLMLEIRRQPRRFRLFHPPPSTAAMEAYGLEAKVTG